MAVADLELYQPTLAETLPRRRFEVHMQRLRSLAENNPQAIADVIQRWLAQDGGYRRLTSSQQPDFWFSKQ
ncbi:MAG: hypothetical protein JOZ39_09215 [Chloroflexi bacterium]|nr:hypothetical protein [Chloroflexota bacterium]